MLIKVNPIQTFWYQKYLFIYLNSPTLPLGNNKKGDGYVFPFFCKPFNILWSISLFHFFLSIDLEHLIDSNLLTFNSTTLHQKGSCRHDAPVLLGCMAMNNFQTPHLKGFHPYGAPASTWPVVTLNSTAIHQKGSCFLDVSTTCSWER